MRIFLAAFPLVVVVACGGSTFSPILSGDGGSSSSSGSGSGAGGSSGSGGSSGGSGSGSGGSSGGSSGSSGGSSGGSSSSSGSGSGGSSGGSSGSSSGGIADASIDSPFPCPDISGGYGQLVATGQGCGDINTSAPECIYLAQQICAFQLSSPTSGVVPAVNGAVILASDGSFTMGYLMFGTVQRSGCTGQWDAGTQTLTLDCGGTGTSQSCTVTMVRTGSACM